MSPTHCKTLSEARTHVSDLINAAESGGTGVVVRHSLHRASVVDADHLRDTLARLLPEGEVVPEAGGWTVLLPGLPIAADGSTYDESLAEMVSRHPQPTRADREAFCESEGWTQVRNPTGPRGHQVTYELPHPDGRILRARISHPPDRSTYGGSLWLHLLRDQLDVCADELWTCVQDRVVPERSAASPTPGGHPGQHRASTPAARHPEVRDRRDDTPRGPSPRPPS